MATHLNISSEFASIVKALQQSPDDPALKQALVLRLPQMKASAKNDPLALFRLAQIYPESSDQYRQLIIKAANMRCTNAMLAACTLCLKSESAADVKKAACYMIMILQSNDSFIVKQSKALLQTYPALNAEMKRLSQTDTYQNACRFFAERAMGEAVSDEELNHLFTKRA